MSEQKLNCWSQKRNLTSNLNQLGAVGLGGLNQWWRIDFLGTKVHKLDVLPSWWCVLLLKRKRGQVCPTRKVFEEEEVLCAFTAICIAPVKWDKSSLLGENIKRDHNGQINLRAKQKFENSFCYNINEVDIVLWKISWRLNLSEWH